MRLKRREVGLELLDERASEREDCVRQEDKQEAIQSLVARSGSNCRRSARDGDDDGDDDVEDDDDDDRKPE